MKSIFSKILLWFFATLLVCMVAITATSFLRSEPNQRDFVFRSVTFELGEAQHAYETGGAEELAKALARMDRAFTPKHHFTDASGKDLVSGQDRSAALKKRPHGPLHIFSGEPLVFFMPSRDQRYRLIVDGFPRWDFTGALLSYLSIGAALSLLCYVMATHLATPIRQLRQKVDELGRGNLAARADARRKDEIGDLSRAFNTMAERIETLLTAERRLLQDVSHELRSPLARLKFAVELARTSEDKEKSLARIRKDVDRLSSLIGELLQVTRAEGDPAARTLKPISLDRLLRDIVEDCAVEAGMRNCSIHLSIGEPLIVEGDQELLLRALENILRNAVRHAPENTSVEVTLGHHGDFAEVEIRDFGKGVPEENLSDIFRPFFRVESDRNRNNGGVGLGLAIAYRAIRLHHGELHAENAKPGLRVSVRLPVGKAIEEKQVESAA